MENIKYTGTSPEPERTSRDKPYLMFLHTGLGFRENHHPVEITNEG